VITINGPSHFYEFLMQQPELEKEVEALSAIVRTAKAIPRGCKCTKKNRIQAATETCVNVLQQYLTKEDKRKIKEAIFSNRETETSESKIEFRHYDLTNEIEKTTLIIE